MEEGPRKGDPNIAYSTFPGWPTAATGLSHSRSKKAQDKFFNKTKATCGSKLKYVYLTGHRTHFSGVIYPQLPVVFMVLDLQLGLRFCRATKNPEIAIDERLMTLRFPHAKNSFATFVSVYSPTLDSSDDVKDRFYDVLYSTLRRILQNNKIILLGDFNARVGRNNDIGHGVIGHHGIGNMNSSGLRPLSLL